MKRHIVALLLSTVVAAHGQEKPSPAAPTQQQPASKDLAAAVQTQVEKLAEDVKTLTEETRKAKGNEAAVQEQLRAIAAGLEALRKEVALLRDLHTELARVRDRVTSHDQSLRSQESRLGSLEGRTHPSWGKLRISNQTGVDQFLFVNGVQWHIPPRPPVREITVPAGSLSTELWPHEAARTWVVDSTNGYTVSMDIR